MFWTEFLNRALHNVSICIIVPARHEYNRGFNCIWVNVEVAEEIEAYAACPAMKKTGTV
jgi:hypothetical protein